MHRFKLLFIFALFALCAVQAFAAENRFPRDYHIYLDYSKSIIPKLNSVTGQRRPNEVLSEQLLALLNDAKGQLVGAEDTVAIYRFGEDIEKLSQSLPGDTAWQSALRDFGAETEGKKLTDLQVVLESIRGHIDQAIQTKQRRAKVFLIASDYIHDDMQGFDLCGSTGRKRYPDD